MNTDNRAALWSAAHGLLFLTLWLLCQLLLQFHVWPLHLLVPLLIYAGLAHLIEPLRRTFPRLSFGRTNAMHIFVALALSASAAALLLGYQSVFQPDESSLPALLSTYSFGVFLVAAFCFSFGNAVLEEVIFRGIIYESAVPSRGNAVAVAATAIGFGLAHGSGYPPGPVGAALAGLFGIALGLLRWWTGGLGLAIGCHFCADATIFAIVTAHT